MESKVVIMEDITASDPSMDNSFIETDLDPVDQDTYEMLWVKAMTEDDLESVEKLETYISDEIMLEHFVDVCKECNEKVVEWYCKTIEKRDLEDRADVDTVLQMAYDYYDFTLESVVRRYLVTPESVWIDRVGAVATVAYFALIFLVMGAAFVNNPETEF